jgi:hypothetical protein
MVTESSARLENSPFYAKGVSYLDEVRLTPYRPSNDEEVSPGFYEYDGVLRHGGHGRVRAILRDEEKSGLAQRALDEVGP